MVTICAGSKFYIGSAALRHRIQWLLHIESFPIMRSYVNLGSISVNCKVRLCRCANAARCNDVRVFGKDLTCFSQWKHCPSTALLKIRCCHTNISHENLISSLSPLRDVVVEIAGEKCRPMPPAADDSRLNHDYPQKYDPMSTRTPTHSALQNSTAV